MEKIVFKKATMNDQLPETLHAVEDHMGGVYFEDESYDYDNDDPYYCETCGESDWPLGSVDTPLEMLALLVEQTDWHENLLEMSDDDIETCLECLIEDEGPDILVEKADFNDALQALIAFRESEKERTENFQ